MILNHQIHRLTMRTSISVKSATGTVVDTEFETHLLGSTIGLRMADLLRNSPIPIVEVTITSRVMEPVECVSA